MNSKVRLKILEPQKDPYFFDLSLSETEIGRASDNDIIIADPLLSRKHLTVFQRGDDYFIKDNNSKNGTFLNGVQITKEEQIRNQDIIKIGQTVLQFFTKVEEKTEEDSQEEVHDASSTQMFSVKNLLSDYAKEMTPPSEGDESSPLQFQNKALITLKDFSLHLISHRGIEELLENIMDFVGENISARRGVLMLKEIDEAELTTKVTRFYEGKPKSKQVKISSTIINAVLENKASLLTLDAQLDERFNSKESIIAENIHSAMCVPLWNNKDVIGLIYMDRSLGEKPFDKEELYLMSSLANMAAIKIENTMLFEETLAKKALEEQLSLAAEIQKSLLPRECPQIKGLDIAASHIPCSYVGGDYYDFFALPQGKFGITIGDVAGKGAAGALLMATLRAALSSQVTLEAPLKDLFFYLNNFIHQSSASNKYITFFYGEVELERGILRFINAGHNPPQIISKNKQIKDLPAGGLSLGFFPDCCYDEGEVQLKEGDILALFTDGITERANSIGKEFEEKAMIKLIKNNVKKDAQGILDTILDSIEEFSQGAPQNDDMTLVILKKL